MQVHAINSRWSANVIYYLQYILATYRILILIVLCRGQLGSSFISDHPEGTCSFPRKTLIIAISMLAIVLCKLYWFGRVIYAS